MSSYCSCSIESVLLLVAVFAILIYVVKLSLKQAGILNKALENNLRILYVMLILAFIFVILNNIF